RVAGQNQIAVALSGCEQGKLQLTEPGVEAIERVTDPELDIGDDLVVAAAAGVKLTADVAEALDQGAFDVRVNVFQLDGEGKVAAFDLAGDLIEGGHDALG